jgi:hypothetical protein
MGKVFRDLFTGTDGKTFAIGRIASVPTLFSGLGLPLGALAMGQTLDFAALGVFYGGVAGGVAALIGLTSHTEPKGGE